MPDADDVDRNKFELEKAKFDFELRKYEAEQQKRDLDNQKLREEVNELRRPWFQKASYFSSLATITIAIVGGLIAFGTDVFKSKVSSLIEEKKALTNSVASLDKTRDDLTAKNKELQARTDSLITNLATLDSEAKIARKDRDKLARDADLAPVYETMNVIEMANRHATGPMASGLVEVVKATKRRQEVIGILESAYKDGQTSEALKTAICFALFETTGNLEWKDRLRQSSVDSAVAAMGLPAPNQIRPDAIFLALLKDEKVFDLSERVRTLRDLYSAVRQMRPDFSHRGPYPTPPDPIYTVLEWDFTALAVFRDPWFDTLGKLYDLREWEKPSFNPNYARQSPNLFWFSTQAFSVLLIDRLSNSITPITPDIVPTDQVSASEDCSQWFPRDFPLGGDCTKPGTYPALRPVPDPKAASILQVHLLGNGLRILPERLPAYKEWVKNNTELIAVWKDRDFEHLRKVSNETMRKLWNNEWVDLTALR